MGFRFNVIFPAGTSAPRNRQVNNSRSAVHGGSARASLPPADDESHQSRRFSSAFFLISLVCCLSLAACSGSKSPDTARASTRQSSIPVGVATAERRDVPVYLKGLGSVTAFNTVSLRARVDGQLDHINFKEGQYVNQGDLLITIDPRPYEVALSQAQASLFRDQAQLRDAQLNYERYKELLKVSGAMSQQQVDTQRAAADQFEGAVRADHAAIDNAKLNLTYCRITAPISGRVGLRLVDVGNMVHAADANPLLVITQLQPISILFTLPEDQLPTVAQHMQHSTLEVDAYSRNDQTKLATGKLLTIDNQIDASTGTGKLKSVFDNKDRLLWPNQFVNVRLLLETRKDSTVIPSAAVQRGPQGTYVFSVKQDNTVAVSPVTVALTEDNLASIQSGISPGDVVVVDGQDKLQPNMKVEPRSGAAPGARSQQPSGSGAP